LTKSDDAQLGDESGHAKGKPGIEDSEKSEGRALALSRSLKKVRSARAKSVSDYEKVVSHNDSGRA